MSPGDIVYVFQNVHDWRTLTFRVHSSPVTFEGQKTTFFSVRMRTPGLLIKSSEEKINEDTIRWSYVLFPQGAGWVLTDWLAVVR